MPQSEALDAERTITCETVLSRELLARVRVALRRLDRERAMKGMRTKPSTATSLRIDYAAGSVWRDDEEIHLTPFEYKLLCLLARNTGKVLTHNYLLKEACGAPYSRPIARRFACSWPRSQEDRARSCEPRYIQTHVGVGYRMMRVNRSASSYDPFSLFFFFFFRSIVE